MLFPVYSSSVTDHCPQTSHGAHTSWWPFPSLWTPCSLSLMLYLTLCIGDSEPCGCGSYQADPPSMPRLFLVNRMTVFSIWYASFHSSSLSFCVLLYSLLPLVLLPSTTQMGWGASVLHWYHVLTLVFAITLVYLWHCIYQKLSAMFFSVKLHCFLRAEIKSSVFCTVPGA